MRNQDTGFDHHRYQKLLSEAVDEDKRLALINLLIEERAKDRLAAQIASDRAAMTASTIAKVLGTPWGGKVSLSTFECRTKSGRQSIALRFD